MPKRYPLSLVLLTVIGLLLLPAGLALAGPPATGEITPPLQDASTGPACLLYPFTAHQDAIPQPGQKVDILGGPSSTKPGWLAWSPDWNTKPDLIRELENPDLAVTAYYNPANYPHDRILNTGDYVTSFEGITAGVTALVEGLIGREMLIPVWDEMATFTIPRPGGYGTYNTDAYRISGFARVRIEQESDISLNSASGGPYVYAVYLGPGMLEPCPLLALTKTAPLTAPAGSRITYTITAGNNGNIAATGAVLSDTLPAEVTFAGPVTLAPEQPGASLAQAGADLPVLIGDLTIEAGQTITVTLPVTVNTGILSGTLVHNTASLTSAEITRPQTGTITLTVTSPPLAPPGPFTLLSPPPASTITTTRPFFDWSDAAGAISYTLVLTGPGSAAVLETGRVTTTVSHYVPARPLPDGDYTWTVLAHNSAGFTAAEPQGLAILAPKDIYLPVILKP